MCSFPCSSYNKFHLDLRSWCIPRWDHRQSGISCSSSRQFHLDDITIMFKVMLQIWLFVEVIFQWWLSFPHSSLHVSGWFHSHVSAVILRLFSVLLDVILWPNFLRYVPILWRSSFWSCFLDFNMNVDSYTYTVLLWRRCRWIIDDRVFCFDYVHQFLRERTFSLIVSFCRYEHLDGRLHQLCACRYNSDQDLRESWSNADFWQWAVSFSTCVFNWSRVNEFSLLSTKFEVLRSWCPPRRWSWTFWIFHCMSFVIVSVFLIESNSARSDEWRACHFRSLSSSDDSSIAFSSQVRIFRIHDSTLLSFLSWITDHQWRYHYL